MSTSTLPVRVRASLDPNLGRWLWLVKWLLAIPHFLVLLLLWPVFAVLTIAAFFAILFTGRYPRAIFEFNVGVLRWNWRVAYYTYGALGTDHYPPFTLGEVEDYPTQLEMEYPEHLSQGLVLVKWWLLAIPHYVVVALFVGGGLRLADQSSPDQHWVWNGGLIGVLTIVAAVVLLVTGRCPRSVYDLLLGLNRWVLRVVAYSALMTDRYPPFRLDMEPDEPGPGQLAVASRSTAGQVAEPTTGTYAGTCVGTSAGSAGTAVDPGGGQGSGGQSWSAGRIVTPVISGLLLIVSLGIGAGGGVLLVADKGLRDSQGFFMSSRQPLSSPGYAVTSGILLITAGVLLVLAVVLMVLALSTRPRRTPAMAGAAPDEPPAGGPAPGIPPAGGPAPGPPAPSQTPKTIDTEGE